MSKIIVFLLLIILFISCKNPVKTLKKINRVEISKQNFESFDELNSSKMKTLITNILISSIQKYEYEVRYSKNDYL